MRLKLPRLGFLRESSSWRLPALLVLTYSPLPPAATLERLGVRVDSDVEAAVHKDTVTGSREELRALLQRDAMEHEKMLELAEYNISQLTNAVGALGTVVYAMIGAVIMLTRPELTALFAYGAAVVIVVLSISGVAFYPAELRLPHNSLFHVFLPPLGLVAGLLAGQPLLGLLLASVPASVLAYREKRNWMARLEGALARLREAAARPWSPLSAVEREWLREKDGWALTDSVKKLIELCGIHGAPEALSEASRVYGRMVDWVRGFSSKGTYTLLFCAISALLSAVAVSASLATYEHMLSYTAMGLPLALPLGLPPKWIEVHVRASLGVISTGLSLLVSLTREGNWRYYPLYVPVFALSCMAGYVGGRLLAEGVW